MKKILHFIRIYLNIVYLVRGSNDSSTILDVQLVQIVAHHDVDSDVVKSWASSTSPNETLAELGIVVAPRNVVRIWFNRLPTTSLSFTRLLIYSIKPTIEFCKIVYVTLLATRCRYECGETHQHQHRGRLETFECIPECHADPPKMAEFIR